MRDGLRGFLTCPLVKCTYLPSFWAATESANALVPAVFSVCCEAGEAIVAGGPSVVTVVVTVVTPPVVAVDVVTCYTRKKVT